ncbi:hypothetical protein [Pedobacter sp. Leaf194]|uniref:hypothetical protein n=1 Tax=Pedobacter sp. Leaf194 TaxID=1736297 RepID=UPI000703B425|nr:hypothetical protein [Pedobacter sp. Leaf194]KQS41409.1 hypothetical protein ASG14_02740 [Pedobacter sp. Leaf194]
MKNGNDIDKFFKEGLEEPEIPFNDAHWQAMEERLHPKPKRRIAPVIWFTAFSGIAAALVIVFFLMEPKKERLNTNAVVKTKVKDVNAEKSNSRNGLGLQDKLSKKAPERMVSKNKPLFADGNRNLAVSKAVGFSQPVTLANTDFEAGIMSGNRLAHTVALNSSVLAEAPTKIVSLDGSKRFPADFGKPKDKVVFKSTGNRQRFVLSILAAPDLTSVQSSGRSNLSGSIGAELTFSLTKRLSITTGAAYAKKIYESDFSLYNPNSTYVFRTQPTNVRANCDVLDIPLNLNFKVFEGKRNSIAVSTGLSSYLMLKEKYSYTYNSTYPGPADYEVRNQNQHYLGIANLGVAIQHKINNKFSISARPFIKIPLTDIGYGNSKLSSTGVAVSVNMNLFKKAN